MKLILHINDYHWNIAPDQYGPTLAYIARAAEEAGFSGIGVADHVGKTRTWAVKSRSWNSKTKMLSQ